MNQSVMSHLRADDEIRVDVVPAHDTKTDAYLRINLGGGLTIFPHSPAQAVELAALICGAVADLGAQVNAKAFAEAMASCTGARSVTVTDTDASQPVTFTQPIRVVCENTLDWAK